MPSIVNMTDDRLAIFRLSTYDNHKSMVSAPLRDAFPYRYQLDVNALLNPFKVYTFRSNRFELKNRRISVLNEFSDTEQFSNLYLAYAFSFNWLTNSYSCRPKVIVRLSVFWSDVRIWPTVVSAVLWYETQIRPRFTFILAVLKCCCKKKEDGIE